MRAVFVLLVGACLVWSKPTFADRGGPTPTPLFGETKVDERQTGVQAMAVDVEGYLWVVSDGGLCRSDGTLWTCVEPRCAGPMLASEAGEIWAQCEEHQLLSPKGRQLSRTEISVPGSKRKLVGVAGRELFFSSTEGTFTVASGAVRRLSPLPAAVVAHGGNVTWLATAAGLLQASSEATPAVILDRPTSVLGVSVRGEAFVAVATGKGGNDLQVFNADGSPSPLRFMVTGRPIRSILIDERHQLLWLSEENGMFAYPLGGGRSVFARSMREGIPYPSVSALLIDGQGLWMGTNQGLARVRINPPVFNIGRAEGMDGDSTFAVTTAQDTVWMAQNNGLTRFENGLVYSAEARNGLKHIDLRTVAVTPDGVVWTAGIVNLLARLDLTTNRFVSEPLVHQPVGFDIHTLRVDSQGNLLMGLDDGGVGKRVNGTFTSVLPSAPGTVNRVRDIIEARNGAVWVSRDDGSVVTILGEQQTTFTLQPKSEALCLTEDSLGSIWVGTGGAGLYRIKQGRIDRITSAQGLWDDRIHGVIEDRYGWLWMSSVRGVFRMSRTNVEAVMEGWAPKAASIAYQTEDGLRNNEASRGFSPSSAKDPQGRVWFSMVAGVTAFDPEASIFATPPRSIHVDVVTVNGVALPHASAPVPVGDGALLFRYSSPGLWDASRLRYRTRLISWDKDWVERGPASEAAFASVPSGRYVFEAQAYSLDRPELHAQTSLTIQLLPPLYRRTWFAAVMAFVFVGCTGLLVAGLRLRKARVHNALMADRTRIAQDIHDSLEQDLCGVKMQVDAAALWLDKDAHRARQHLGRAADLVSDGMVDMRSAIWGLRAGTVQGSELAAGLEQRLLRSTDAAAMKLSFSVQGEPPAMPSLVATQIMYIAREGVTNAMKHAHATRVSVTLDFGKPGIMCLAIEDDGVGMPSQQSGAPRDGGLSGGLGLEGMRARAALVGGELSVTCPDGGGTLIRLTAALGRG